MSTLKVNNIVAYSGTHVSGTFSGVFSGSFNSSRIDALEAFSSSLDNTFATDLVVNSLSGAFNSFTAALDNTYATDAQLYQLYQATRSIELTTGSLIGITNGLMAFTAALDSTYATDVQLYQLYQATRSLELLSGSLIGITNGLMAFTAALDSTYATDAQLLPILQTTASLNSKTGSYATTGSNQFNGNQTITGSLTISSSATFTNIGPANFIGNQQITGSLNVRTVNDNGSGIVIGNQIEATQAKTRITNGTTVDGILTSQHIFEVGTDGVLSAYQVVNSLSEGGPSLTNERITELTTGSFKIGFRITNDDGEGESLTAFNGWEFGTVDTVSAITFPDSTVQKTAFLNNGIVSSSQQIKNYNVFATTGSNTFVGNQTITGSLNVTGSVNIDNVIKLAPVETFPTGQAGMLVASASYGKTNLYMYDGSDWKWLVTGSIA